MGKVNSVLQQEYDLQKAFPEGTFAGRSIQQSEAGRNLYALHMRMMEILLYGEAKTPMPGAHNP